MIGRIFSALFRSLLVVICLAAGAGLSRCSFEQLRDLRKIERVPETEIGSLLPGEAKTTGKAAPAGQVVVGPYSGVTALYLIDLVEREETDSDGDKSWVTVREDVSGGDFFLIDGEDAVLLRNPQSTQVNAEMKHQHREGDMRYSEYRIDPDDTVFASGYVLAQGGSVFMDFVQEGDYFALISTSGETSERSGMAGASMITIALATMAFSVAVMLTCGLLRIHLTMVFLGIQAGALAIICLGFGLYAAHEEIVAATERVERLGEERLTRLQTLSGDPKLDWSSLPNLPWFAASARREAKAAMLNHAQNVNRFNRLISRPPEWFVAIAMGTRRIDAPSLPDEVREEYERRETAFVPTRLNGFIAGIISSISVVLAAVFVWLGFGTVKKKRLIENIPTTPAAGVAYGLSELLGAAVPRSNTTPLQGPLSEAECLYYHYVITERRGSGKNARTVTILNEKKLLPFILQDLSGEISVLPDGADFLCNKKTSRTIGRQTHVERRIECNDAVYVLGTAVPDPETGERLVITQGETKNFYLISNLSEIGVLLHKARVAFAWLTAGMNMATICALALFTWMGGLNALAYSLAAGGPAVYAIGLLGVLMFNDLVFLRQRTRMTWSNIEVALKKRYDLVDRIQTVVAEYLRHESETQTAMTSLRGTSDVRGGLFALQENYPDLKASPVMQQISSALIRVENELSFMRDGFNNAVERYNTRRGHFPEVLLARAFVFKEAAFWSGDDSTQDRSNG